MSNIVYGTKLSNLTKKITAEDISNALLKELEEKAESIREAVKDADAGKFATDEEVNAIFAKYSS